MASAPMREVRGRQIDDVRLFGGQVAPQLLSERVDLASPFVR
ncbi:hypothetical protein COLSTE_02124 [Collinsella stercoris DSM 13279]|uniref:Uncharacterized protein n=1 Tax=Collinsella stercoris DSM 13279 TaxID=445975 RepID=B6GDE4_9ACTN|nr:hypothetical protein COLSTE_02124 [Collinsella stercoris DSM 13279]